MGNFDLLFNQFFNYKYGSMDYKVRSRLANYDACFVNQPKQSCSKLSKKFTKLLVMQKKGELTGAPFIRNLLVVAERAPEMHIPTFLFLWRSYKSVDDLEKTQIFQRISQHLIENRRRFRIAIIDDENFPKLENLRRNGYSIDYFRDIESIEALEKFDIILCDLIGVGTALNPTLQGSHIISELKKSYPEKIIIAFTGGGQERLIETAIKSADHYLKKDKDIEEWSNTLDEAIKSLANPAVGWKKLRHRLLDGGLTPLQLTKIEDVFVRKLLKGKTITASDLEQESSHININISPIIKTIFEQLVRFSLLYAETRIKGP